MPRGLGWSSVGGRFLMSEVPLYTQNIKPHTRSPPVQMRRAREFTLNYLPLHTLLSLSRGIQPRVG